MDVEQQQGTWTQLSLFEEEMGSVRPGASGEGGTGPAASEEWQASTALSRRRALTGDLMERVCERENLNRAYKRVKANKGAPGIDGMTVGELYGWLKEHNGELVETILEGNYEPQAVLGKEIDKPGGGKRRLGIPTAVDRLVQQGILQVLEGILDPTFSESSYGFRCGRNAHQAVKQAAEYVAEGRGVVVDIDLKKYFDWVNHDMLMARLARHVSDKRLLRIVRRFLEAGMMWNGVRVERHEGTPQGGPLTPPTTLQKL
jgi:RNA-directed DNA polymerase